MIFTSALLLLTITATFKCVNPVKLDLCNEMRRSNKTTFDYAFTDRSGIKVAHYIVINGKDLEIYEYSDMSLIIWPYPGVILKDLIRDTGSAFSIRDSNRKFIDSLFCYYKVKMREYKCKTYVKVGKTTPKHITFNCNLQPIEQLIAYHPQSYHYNQRRAVIFIERVVSHTNNGSNQRNVWISYWPNDGNAYCDEVHQNNSNTSNTIPNILNAISKSELEITGILSIVHNNTPAAIILFHQNRTHLFCVTYENELSANCQIEKLRTYLDCRENNETNTTDNDYTSTHTTNSTNSNTRIKILIYAILNAIAITIFVIQLLILLYTICVTKNESIQLLAYRSEPLTETT